MRALLTLTIIGNILYLLLTATNWISGGRVPVDFWAPVDALKNPVPDPLQPAFTPKVDNADVLVTVADPTPAQTTLEVIALGAGGAVAWLVISILARRIVISALRADP